MGIKFCIVSLYSIQAKLKNKKRTTAVFELVHVGFLRFLEQSANESGRMGAQG